MISQAVSTALNFVDTAVERLSPHLDNAISAVSPRLGLVRAAQRAQMSAFGESGYIVPGSRRKAMKGVRAPANSPSADILNKLSRMRGMSRDLYMNSPLAVSILERRNTHDIGSGLQYQARIDSDFLGMSQDESDKAGKNLEREFDLWAESFNSDFDGINYYGDNQGLGYLNMLLSGDFFWMPIWRQPREKGFPYHLCIKLIDADLCRNPIGSEYNQFKTNGKDIEGGVEYDKKGQLAGYYIWNTYPNETTRVGKIGSWVFVPAFDSEGRRQIYHVFNPKRIKQRRGVPILAPAVEPLKQMTRLAEAELMNALVSSFFSVFVRDQSGMGQYIPDTVSPEESVTGGGSYGNEDPIERQKNLGDEFDLEMGHGNIMYLDDDKDVTVAEPRKTDRDFGAFWNAIGTQVSAVGGVPFERAQMLYTTSYTAARAATNDAWLGSLMGRSIINRRMNYPVLGEWFTEAILRGRVSAPGFFDDYAYRRAWMRSSWVGFGQGFLNPLQEAKGDTVQLNNKTATRQDIYAQRHGGRWDAAMDRRAGEDRYLMKLGIDDAPDQNEIVGPDGQKDEEEQGAADSNN